jgi:hypothetical protein
MRSRPPCELSTGAVLGLDQEGKAIMDTGNSYPMRIGAAGPNAFLAHLRAEWRGAGGNLFFNVVRNGVTSSPEAVVATVRQGAASKLTEAICAGETRRATDYRRLLEALDADPGGALAFARAVIERETGPAARPR